MSWVDDHFEELFRAFVKEYDQSKWQSMCFELEAYAAEQAPVIWMFPEPALYACRRGSTSCPAMTAGCISTLCCRV